jgi:hypothetical protein
LRFAAEEADKLRRRWIGAEHLLLGILRARDSAAGRLLLEKGMRLESTRAQLSSVNADEP